VQYVTLRPRTPGAVGRVASSSRRIDVGAKTFIASAGPIAEALQRMRLTEGEDLSEDWDDPWGTQLTVALLDGGQADLAESAGMLDHPAAVALLRAELEKAWEPVTELAAALLQHSTVPGRLVHQILKNI
jgi:hypothetical protein